MNNTLLYGPTTTTTTTPTAATASAGVVLNSVSPSNTPRTSQSHPINISWILEGPPPTTTPHRYPSATTTTTTHSHHNHHDNNTTQTPAYDPIARELVEQAEAAEEASAANGEGGGGGGSSLLANSSNTILIPTPLNHQQDSPLYGNLALTSCPGKKVRLSTGPVNGRAMINRDLNSDFERFSSFGITTIVNCLNDSELKFLGAPIDEYIEAATRHGVRVLRLPVIEGAAPDSIEEIEVILVEMEKVLSGGKNVLCHCRGGIGRAGLVACCYLLRQGFCKSADSAIRLVRQRRSPKAIETKRQEDFIEDYFQWCVSGGAEMDSSVTNK